MAAQLKMLTVPEVAERLGIAKLDLVRRWITHGELKAMTIAGTKNGRATYRVSEVDLNSFIESRQVVPIVAEQARSIRRRRDRATPVHRYF
jgi:excisionase family DNA binding protein